MRLIFAALFVSVLLLLIFFVVEKVSSETGPPAESQMELPTLQAGVRYGLQEFEMIGVLSIVLLVAVGFWIRWYTHRPRDTEGHVILPNGRPPRPIRR